jgi:hypothetical protein
MSTEIRNVPILTQGEVLTIVNRPFSQACAVCSPFFGVNECYRDFSPTVLSAKLLGFDSEVLPVRYLSLGITIMFALTVLAASKHVAG